MAGYYNEETGEWVETGDVGQLPGPLPDTTGTGNLPGWTVKDGVWTDPSGGTYDLSYLNNSGITPGILSTLSKFFSGNSAFGPAGAFLAAGGIGKLLNNLMGSGPTGPAGYRGGIPEYVATRTQTPLAQQRPVTYESITPKPGEAAAAVMRQVPYRPGQGGITYFTPMQYTYQGRDLAAPTAATATPTTPTTPDATKPPSGTTGDYEPGSFIPEGPGMINNDSTTITAATGGFMPGGGIAMLARGGSGSRYLRGPGDGVSDSIPARFEKSGQPARLADGEFVIDARTVSELGNGSSEAGARKLYAMMDRVHKARKTAKRGKPSGADKFLPK